MAPPPTALSTFPYTTLFRSAFDDARKNRVTAVEAGLIRHRNEELRAGTVGLPGNLGRRDGAASLLLIVALGLEDIEAAGTVSPARRRVFRHRVAALDDAVLDHPEEGGAVVRSGLRGLDEQRHVIRRAIGQQVHD